MDKKPKGDVETAVAAAPVHPIMLSNQQFEQLLIAVRDRPLDALDPRYPLNTAQKNALLLFENAAVGLGVTGYGTPARPLTRLGKLVSVAIPEHAARARVYSKSGVEDISLDDCAGTLRFERSADDLVARIDFLDAKGELLEVTGGEPVPTPHRATAV